MDLRSPSLHLTNAGIMGVYHHARCCGMPAAELRGLCMQSRHSVLGTPHSLICPGYGEEACSSGCAFHDTIPYHGTALYWNRGLKPPAVG